MIRIKPEIDFQGRCPRCPAALSPQRILWQGIHVCVVARCAGCGAEITEDLRVGQAIFTPYQVDLEEGVLTGDPAARRWFGEPLIESLQNPDHEQEVGLAVEKIRHADEVVILNCIDHLYGHALLKLLNAESILRERPDLGLVVIVPRCLRWMVPDGAAEVWTVDIPLGKAQRYYSRLHDLVEKECGRFGKIWLSPAHSHPAAFDITRFTGVPRHDFSAESFRITFIWREDRPWLESRAALRVARRTGLMEGLIFGQNRKVQRLFDALRHRFPRARFTVAGMGTRTRFPDWIEDHRVDRFDDETERRLCRLYAESRLVIGVHGSNMLLPSAHGGMTIDLMPSDRWPNVAQDILYQEADSRMASYRYRYLPLGTPVAELARIAGDQIAWHEAFRVQMISGAAGADCLCRGGEGTT